MSRITRPIRSIVELNIGFGSDLYYRLESFLRLHDPEVTVPFWASVLDNEMEDPTESVIFSGAFFGPGVGLPTSGPFRGWQQINPATVFNRNVGGGQLYTYEGIDAILRRRRNSELLFPTAEADSNFEEQHGGPHIFVGGTMNDLNAAARDPIFFSHHSFVDQIWERFRYNQRAAGIPTETDYPWVPNDPRYNPAQSPTNITGFFPDGQLNLDYIQITGYSDAFFQLVQYEQVPTCPLCGGSQYLRCNPTTNRCMSRSIAEMRTANVDIDTLPGLEQAAPGRKKRLIAYKENNVCHRKPFINDFSVNRLQLSTAIGARQTHAMEYAYVPVKIVTKRPSNYKHFSKYSLYEKPMNGLGFKQELVNIGTNKPYRSCDKSLDSPGKIKIVAYGINHGAYSEEYVITDNRLAISESSGVIAVKLPTGLHPSEVMVAAFDSCGRVCRPYCKSGANMAHNSYFTGGVRISVTSPLIYGTSYGEALLNVWDIQTENMCPTMDYNKVPLTFFCEYTDNWIWGGSSRTGSGSGSSKGGKIYVRALRTGRGRAGRMGVSNPRKTLYTP
ncbi:hypothetical protein DPMN_008917 [Dreissena polymorpha]|uniref:Tyrosinase copper-binding domain-containing protein n=1 Tax=Dreissena polymorpha TaxID=45954 RepID=A0A9D4MYP0_DREPO|nr:hypothetical protein DPMN_008917 [Dreissena polymorpha]